MDMQSFYGDFGKKETEEYLKRRNYHWIVSSLKLRFLLFK